MQSSHQAAGQDMYIYLVVRWENIQCICTCVHVIFIFSLCGVQEVVFDTLGYEYCCSANHK